MAASRKREGRENQFYNVGEQGRKTGIRLEDRGVRDEYGMEPVSGIFSSPQKGPSPATRRGEEATLHSESMDIDDSSLPNATSGHMLKGHRASLPPPRSRSPIKTSIGATPRRSLGRVARSSHKSDTPEEDADVAVRRLDFHQEVSVQETPALSGSGTRRELARRDVYDIEQSPSLPGDDEDAIGSDDVAIEESFAGLVDEDAIASGDIEETLQEELSRVEVEEEDPVPKQPGRRGRKRKSDGLESAAENESSPAARSKRIRTANAQASAEKARKAAQAPAPKPRGRPPRQLKQASDPVEEEPEEEGSAAEAPFEEAPQAEGTPAPPPKKRGRAAKAKEAAVPENVPEEESSAPKRRGRQPKDKPAKTAQANESTQESVSKKSSKPASKAKGKAAEKPGPTPIPPDLASGKLVDSLGNPIARDELDKRSVTSAGSSFRRARQLSVFREVGPDEIGRVGRTGRHHVKPIDFWMNERAEYARDGTLKAITHHLDIAEEPRKRKAGGKKKARKRAASEEEDEEEVEKEEWEVNEGVFVGAFREFDVATETTGEELLESTLAWAEKGIEPQQVPNAQFKFTKLGSAGDRSFFSWGCIDLDEGDVKRSKNSRRMHMVFHVTRGRVEVTVNEENVFAVGKGGVWQVPRGNNYSIRNLAKGKTRVFFAQAFESTITIE